MYPQSVVDICDAIENARESWQCFRGKLRLCPPVQQYGVYVLWPQYCRGTVQNDLYDVMERRRRARELATLAHEEQCRLLSCGDDTGRETEPDEEFGNLADTSSIKMLPVDLYYFMK